MILVGYQVKCFLYGLPDTGVLQRGIRTRPFRLEVRKVLFCRVLPYILVLFNVRPRTEPPRGIEPRPQH